MAVLVTVDFLTMPLAELEHYGLCVRLIAILEEHIGLTVGDLQMIDSHQLLKIKGIGQAYVKQLQQALRKAWYEHEHSRSLSEIEKTS